MRLAALFALFLLAFPACADEVLVADGRKLVGRVTEETDDALTVLTYKEGPIAVPRADVKARKAAKTLYDDYDAKKSDFEDTADGHVKLGDWCKSQGLTFQAREEWKQAVGLDAAHEAAHKALGDIKGKDGAWVAFEKQQEAKGLELFEGKWLRHEQADQIRAKRHPVVAWVLTATYFEDSDRAFLESWGERAKEASAFMWELSEGQMYVKQITVTDKGGPADFRIINKDSMKIRKGAYAEAGADSITAPGQILGYTFLHELIHFKYLRPDHCDNCHHCIMSSDPNANQLCDDGDHKAPPQTSCWGAIRAFHKDLRLKPLTRKAKLGPVPETKVVIQDR